MKLSVVPIAVVAPAGIMLASRGIELDAAQAELLEQWRGRSDTPGSDSPEE